MLFLQQTPTHPQGEGSLPPPFVLLDLPWQGSLPSLPDPTEQIQTTHSDTNLYHISIVILPGILVLSLKFILSTEGQGPGFHSFLCLCLLPSLSSCTK